MRGPRRVAVGVVVAAAVLHAWTRRPSPPAPAALPALPPGARFEETTRTAEDWRREGYLEMVSPLRPPSSEDGRTRIAVFVRFPPGSRARTVEARSGVTLDLPEGARADRLELDGDGPADAAPSPAWRVLDVRGITFAASGQRLRVLRPKRDEGHDLFGLDWPRGDAQAAATAALGELVLRGIVAGPSQPDARTRAAAHLRGLNDCPSCHAPQRARRRTIHDPGVVNRGTDAAGFFQLTSILRDRQPFETYRPRDMNRGDPLVARFCGAERVDATTTRCPDGTVLEGQLDVRAGLRRGDLHTQRVCESRRALSGHLDERGRTAFREALTECAVDLP
jgi:hypothetical protein